MNRRRIRRRSRGKSDRLESWSGRAGRVVLTGILLLLVILIGGSRLGLFGGSVEPGDANAVVYQSLVAETRGASKIVDVEATGLWRPLRGVAPSPEMPPQDEAEWPEIDGAARNSDASGSDGMSSPGVAGVAVTSSPPAEPTRVFLANGCGASGLAAELRDPFRHAGFDVCGVSNADRSDYSETLVIDRCGNPAAARQVCAFLQERWGVGRVVLQCRAAAMTEVLVILGADISARRAGGSWVGSR